jgi:hypothetical protein
MWENEIDDVHKEEEIDLKKEVQMLEVLPPLALFAWEVLTGVVLNAYSVVVVLEMVKATDVLELGSKGDVKLSVGRLGHGEETSPVGIISCVLEESTVVGVRAEVKLAEVFHQGDMGVTDIIVDGSEVPPPELAMDLAEDNGFAIVDEFMLLHELSVVVDVTKVLFVEDRSSTKPNVAEGVKNFGESIVFEDEDAVTLVQFVIVGSGVAVALRPMLVVTDMVLVLAIVISDIEIVPIADERGATVFVPLM